MTKKRALLTPSPLCLGKTELNEAVNKHFWVKIVLCLGVCLRGIFCRVHLIVIFCQLKLSLRLKIYRKPNKHHFSFYSTHGAFNKKNLVFYSFMQIILVDNIRVLCTRCMWKTKEKRLTDILIRSFFTPLLLTQAIFQLVSVKLIKSRCMDLYSFLPQITQRQYFHMVPILIDTYRPRITKQTNTQHLK